MITCRNNSAAPSCEPRFTQYSSYVRYTLYFVSPYLHFALKYYPDVDVSEVLK